MLGLLVPDGTYIGFTPVWNEYEIGIHIHIKHYAIFSKMIEMQQTCNTLNIV